MYYVINMSTCNGTFCVFISPSSLLLIRSSRYLYGDDGSTTGYMEDKIANTTIMFTHNYTM